MDDLSGLPSVPDWYSTKFDPFLLEVGRISKLWAATEYALDKLIWFLMDAPDRVGACLTGQMIGPAPRMRALISLAGERGVNASIVGELRALDKIVRGVGAQRNRYSHDTLFVQLQSGEIKTREITADNSVKLNDNPADMISARKLWIKIQSVNVKIYELANRIYSWPLTPLGPPDVRYWTNPLPRTQDQGSISSNNQSQPRP
jgi:hypothetical protein